MDKGRAMINNCQFGFFPNLSRPGYRWIVIGMIALAASINGVSANILTNPGFESDFTGWDDWGNSFIETATVQSGAKSARVGPNAGGRAQRIESLIDGTQYTMCAWSKLDDLSTSAWMGVNIYDSGSTLIGNHQWTLAWTSWTEQSVTFTYPATGSYANVWVWTDTSTNPVYVDDFVLLEGSTCSTDPTAGFSWSATGLAASFTDSSTDPDGSIVSWLWDFGDGNTSNAQNPSHTYASGGSYSVNLAVTDNDGNTGSANQYVAVSTSTATVNPNIKIDHFGYRPADTKMAIFGANPGSNVEIRNLSDTVVYSVPADGGSIQYKGNDGQSSGDEIWWVDFSDLNTAGTYHVYSSALGGVSYNFEIRENIYNEVVRTAMRSFYLQRCNTPKDALFAGDWSDLPACHTQDINAGPASGHVDRGLKDLTGGWHDAGDYNKYVWSDLSTAVLNMLRAFTDNPGVFPDGDLNIPESGNGIPDMLDEIKWELDWMLKMQLSDGSVLHQLHTDGWGWNSPPSADTNSRYYQDPNLESGSVFAGTLAHASRVFAEQGMTAYANTLKSAAVDAWTWLLSRGDSHEKAWAAAEVFATDSTVTTARDYVDNYYSGNWSGKFFNPLAYDTHAALTYIQAPGATTAVVNNMRANVGAQVNYIFANNDFYRNGMPDWSYHWGSNKVRASYGIFLHQAVKLGETGSHTVSEALEHAQDFLHFFHGQNPINMVYLTNMAGIGGEHSSWQIYHGWFGASGNTYSTTNFLGKPPGVTEPDYPYFKGTDNHGVSDNNTSLLGPAPGFVPGGPNKDYSGTAVPPSGEVYYNRFYRDWADQSTPSAVTWEISENSISYQGAYVALGAYYVDTSSPPTAPAEKLVIGYFPYWRSSFTNTIEYSKFSHLNYFHAWPHTNGSGVLLTGHLDLNNLATVRDKTHAVGATVSISLGGAGVSGGFPAMAASAPARAVFIQDVVDFVLDNGLDGADLDWEWSWSEDYADDYSTLIEELDAALEPHGKLLTVAVVPGRPTGKEYIRSWAIDNLDWVGVMTYDMNWDNAEHSTFADMVSGIADYTGIGVPINKLVVGVPFYGRNDGWTSEKTYADLVSLCPGMTPADNYCSGHYFNGPELVQQKAQHVLANDLAGVMIWEITQDTFPGGTSTSLTTALTDIQGTSTPLCPSPSSTLAAGTWTMFSLACDPGQANRISELLSDDLTGAYGTHWIVYKQHETTQPTKYIALSDSDRLNPGVGYWMLHVSGGTWRLGPGYFGNEVPFTIALAEPVLPATEHYNMVGNTRWTELDWADVNVLDTSNTCHDGPSAAQAIGLISATIHKRIPSGYLACDDTGANGACIVAPNEGFWVKATDNTESDLRLQIGADCSAPAPASVQVRSAENPGKTTTGTDNQHWTLRMRIDAGLLVDPISSLGQRFGAAMGYDVYDLEELPPDSTPNMSLVFPHPDWVDGRNGDYATDYHPLGTAADEWAFKVNTSEDLDELVLSWWEAPEDILERLKLVDDDLGVSIKPLKNGKSISEYATSWNGLKTRHFRWVLKKVPPGKAKPDKLR